MLLGIDVGGTKCAVITGDDKGNVLSKKVIKTVDFKNTYRQIFELVREHSGYDAIGISCGGPLDEEKGIVLSPPNLPDWDRVKIVDDIEKEFKVPCKIRNDANACALAEHKFGAGVGSKNVVFLTFGTGLGAGLILDDKLYSGTNGNAGEVGHIRMEKAGPIGFNKAGSFEGFCSGQGIRQLGEIFEKRAKAKGITPSYSLIENYTTKDIAEHARKGDKTAIAVFNKCGTMLGKGLSIIVDTLNPQKIVIGSVYARCVDLLYKPMMKIMKKECIGVSLDVCEVVPAKLSENIGDVAALAVALEAKNETR